MFLLQKLTLIYHLALSFFLFIQPTPNLAHGEFILWTVSCY